MEIRGVQTRRVPFHARSKSLESWSDANLRRFGMATTCRARGNRDLDGKSINSEGNRHLQPRIRRAGNRGATMTRKYIKRGRARGLQLAAQTFFSAAEEMLASLETEADYYHMPTSTYIRVLLGAILRIRKEKGFATALHFLEHDKALISIKEAVNNDPKPKSNDGSSHCTDNGTDNGRGASSGIEQS